MIDKIIESYTLGDKRSVGYVINGIIESLHDTNFRINRVERLLASLERSFNKNIKRMKLIVED
jgi:hypothetical protein